MPLPPTRALAGCSYEGDAVRYEKLSAGMMLLVQDLTNGGSDALAERVQLFGLMNPRRAGGAPRVSVFIRTVGGASLDNLKRRGIVAHHGRGRTFTAEVSLDQLGMLSEDERVERIQSSRYLRPLMDIAAEAVGLSDVRSTFGLTGGDVVIGVVDTGIDASHPAFANRMHAVWDQTLPGKGVPEGSYGRELTGVQIALATDENGHGTHVAGIAAGDHAQYSGVAAGSRLVIVKSDLLNTHIADGIRYIFRVAADLGLPAVVNLSLGGHADAHDGSDGLSEIIDQESGPGRIAVCAAGNEGDDDIHALVQVAASEEVAVPFRVPQVTDGSGNHIIPAPYLNGWYPGADEIEVSVQSPNGHQTPWQGPISGGPPTRSYDLPNAIVTIVTSPQNPDNGDHQFIVDIKHPANSGGPEPAGTWRLRLRGKTVTDGTVHIWALDNAGGTSVTIKGPAANDGFKIGSPGSAKDAITVAAYTSRVDWSDAAGSSRQVGLALKDVSSFSSEGPTRDGRRKPDLAAPGAMICAPASAQSTFDQAFAVVGGFRMEAGTSMAAPFVTGLIALLLERDPSLDAAAAKRLLLGACSIPGRAPGSFDPKWGHGVFLAPALENALAQA